MSRADTWALATGEIVMVSKKLAKKIGYPAAAAAQQLHYRGKPEKGLWVRYDRETWGAELGCSPTAAYEALTKLVDEGLAERDESRKPFAYRLSYEGAQLVLEELGEGLAPRAEERCRNPIPSASSDGIRQSEGSTTGETGAVGPDRAATDLGLFPGEIGSRERQRQRLLPPHSPWWALRARPTDGRTDRGRGRRSIF